MARLASQSIWAAIETGLQPNPRLSDGVIGILAVLESTGTASTAATMSESRLGALAAWYPQFESKIFRTGMRKSPRDRRLNSDFQSVQKLVDESTIFSFNGRGEPPQKYRLMFKGAGFQRDRKGAITVSHHHEILVELGAAYPRMVPNLAWQTPVFHPNVSNNGVVCLGGYGTHWVPSLTLSEMCTMLWDMIRYKNFDTESPYNREAALWAKTQTDFALPVDRRSIRDRISGEKPVIIQPEVLVTRVTENREHERVARTTSDGIEIIESGIEIVERPPVNDGIIFLD